MDNKEDLFEVILALIGAAVALLFVILYVAIYH